MSRLLMPKSCTTAKRMNTTTNHEGMALWWTKGSNALAPVPMLRTKVPTTAPSVMMRISGTAVPRKTQPTMPFFDVPVGQ